jgi:hypothetical protein
LSIYSLNDDIRLYMNQCIFQLLTFDPRIFVGPSPASRHGAATSPGHPALHSPQTMSKDGDPSKPSGLTYFLSIEFLQ